MYRQATRGTKESSAEDFALIRDRLAPLHTDGRSVALLHHFGKLTELSKERAPGERMAGSGAMHGALDIGVYITRSQDKARRLRLEVETRDFAAPDAATVALVGTGSGPHGGFTYADTATYELLAVDDEGVDRAAQLDELFRDGVWRTQRELVIALGAGTDDIHDTLVASPERFRRIEKELAVRVGRSSTAKPWGTVAMLRELDPDAQLPLVDEGALAPTAPSAPLPSSAAEQAGALAALPVGEAACCAPACCGRQRCPAAECTRARLRARRPPRRRRSSRRGRRLVTRSSIVGFYDRRGVWRELRDPDSRASSRQLLWLNANGMLDVVPHRHQLEPITRGEAAAAIADIHAEDGV